MRNVCGLDVHKDNVFVCILKENSVKIQFKCGILTKELDGLRDLLVREGVGEIAMESTQGVVTRTDMDMLVGWAGLKPRNDESNGKFKSRKITHGNKYLRKTLAECAWGASRTQGCFYNKFSYHQTQVRKKTKMKVHLAVAAYVGVLP